MNMYEVEELLAIRGYELERTDGVSLVFKKKRLHVELQRRDSTTMYYYEGKVLGMSVKATTADDLIVSVSVTAKGKLDAELKLSGYNFQQFISQMDYIENTLPKLSKVVRDLF
jgi:hypothetical protein